MDQPAPTRIRIGTSGWHYGHWRGSFYPRLSPKGFLDHYARVLRTVEINNSFYRLPEPETLARWRDAVPPDFVFAAKASRYITHIRKLMDPRAPLALFLDRMATLGEKLGPILFQLPPSLEIDMGRLREFLSALPKGCRAAFEFRHPSWFNEATYAALEEHGAAFCIYELAGRRSPPVATGRTVYVRLHGPGGAYRGNYDQVALAGWARSMLFWAAEGREVYCYFDNTDDPQGYAPHNAVALRSMVEEESGGPAEARRFDEPPGDERKNA